MGYDVLLSIRNADFWIRTLGLVPHPEGGYYAETYRSAEHIPLRCLPSRFNGDRPFATSIYFLLKGKQVSRLHRLRADELWNFHDGSAIEVCVISPGGLYSATTLGPDPAKGEVLQTWIPAGSWFGARLMEANSYGLVGCVVAPGFEFADYEPGMRVDLLSRYPQHQEIINSLTTS